MHCADDIVAWYCTTVWVEARRVKDLGPGQFAARWGCGCYRDEIGMSLGGRWG